MEKEEIGFIKERIKELEKFQKRGITNIAWSGGKSFSVELALITFKNVLI